MNDDGNGWADGILRRGKFCGPYALSWLTKTPADEVAKIIRENRSRKSLPIGRTHVDELMECARKLGWKVEKHVMRPRVSFASWLDWYHVPTRHHLVRVGNHFLAVSGELVSDSLYGTLDAYREGLDRHRRKMVSHYLRLKKN